MAGTQTIEAVFNTGALANALKIIDKAVPRKPLLPIHLCALFRIKEGSCTITGGDNSRQLKVMVGCKSPKDFSTCIPIDPIIDILSGFPEEEIRIVISKTAAGKVNSHIKTIDGKRAYKIPVMPAVDYPELKAENMSHRITIEAQYVSDLFNFCKVPIKSNNIITQMQGILLSIVPGSITGIGMEGGAWFNRAKIPTINDSGSESKIIVPGNLSDFINPEPGQTVVIEHNGKWVSVMYQGISSVAAMYEGKFPNAEGLISAKKPEFVEVDKTQLIEGCRRLNVVGDPVRIGISIGEMSTILSSTNEMIGSDGSEEIMSNDQGLSGRQFYVNTKFLQSILNSIPGEQVEIYTGPNTREPVFIVSETPVSSFMGVVGKLFEHDVKNQQ